MEAEGWRESEQMQQKHLPRCRLRPPATQSQQNCSSLFKGLGCSCPGDWSGSRGPELQVGTNQSRQYSIRHRGLETDGPGFDSFALPLALDKYLNLPKVFLSFFFLQLYPWHIKVPQPETESELQLPA